MVLKLKIENLDVILDTDYSYLNANVSSASSTITVDSISKFAINQVILIGSLGSEDAEIIKTHTSTAPSGNTVTLVSNTIKAHNRGTKVSILNFDSYELSHSTTTTGTKTALLTTTGNGLVAIDPERDITLYNDKEYSSGYYFYRAINTIGATFTAATDDTITSSAHGLKDGETIKVISSSALPAGLSTVIQYYIINSATNTFKVSLTAGGTAVDITDTGTGTHTWYRTSVFSDPKNYNGYDWNQVGYIKENALRQLGESKDETLTDSFLNEVLWEGRRELDSLIDKWSFRTTFNSDIGTVTEGIWSIAVPSTLRNPNGPENILGLRVGKDGRNITYITKHEFDRWYENVSHTTVATSPSVGSTSIVLTDTGDFESSGTIRIASNSITYTANSITTNTLSGIPASGDGSITIAHATGTNVWQNASLGLPRYYTIFEGYIYFNVPFEDTYIGRNIFMDFYKELPVYDSDADTLDEPNTDMFVSFLKWKIKYLRAKGILNLQTDPDYFEWINRRNVIVKGQRADQYVGFSPDISSNVE